MKRLILLLFAISIAMPVVATSADAARVRVVKRGKYHRTTVVVRRGFPIRRALPAVVVRAPRRVVVVRPAVYLAPVVWTAAVVTLPPRAALAWEDSETLVKDEDWTESTLNVNERGRKLFIEIHGKAQLSFAEVVFANEEARVVDFNNKTRGTGIYSLLDFADGRKVDHVRIVARAKSDEAKLVLRMAK